MNKESVLCGGRFFFRMHVCIYTKSSSKPVVFLLRQNSLSGLGRGFRTSPERQIAGRQQETGTLVSKSPRFEVRILQSDQRMNYFQGHW